jgi:hypothetical protein
VCDTTAWSATHTGRQRTRAHTQGVGGSVGGCARSFAAITPAQPPLDTLCVPWRRTPRCAVAPAALRRLAAQRTQGEVALAKAERLVHNHQVTASVRACGHVRVLTCDTGATENGERGATGRASVRLNGALHRRVSHRTTCCVLCPHDDSQSARPPSPPLPPGRPPGLTHTRTHATRATHTRTHTHTSAARAPVALANLGEHVVADDAEVDVPEAQLAHDVARALKPHLDARDLCAWRECDARV